MTADGLNSEQNLAVTTVDGPVLILAGAGSGKTRVITYRIARLINEYDIFPNRILAVTFTNKAAQEMRERCTQILGKSKGDPFIKTFHSLCLYILRRDGKHLGLGNNFTVYDSDMQESLIKELLKKNDLDTKEFRPGQLANLFSKAKDSFQTAEDFSKQAADDHYGKTVAKIFLAYEKEKFQRNALDFGDLILSCVILFRDFPMILEKYQAYWQYIMVDEYQDTNKIQYHLVKALASKHKNICVVGDDDQSIYSWRGADISNILNFNKDYPDSLVVKLEENYRSTKTIIDTAAKIISHNSKRTEKTLFTNNPEGEKIRLTTYQNETEEANGILQKIIKLKNAKNRYADNAIFYRTNSQSRYFEEAFRKKGIPYKIFGGFRFFDRKEVKDLIAYLSVIVNPVDSTSLLRIINSPPRGLGETTITRLANFSIEQGISLLECLGKQIPEIKKGTAKKLADLHRMFENFIGEHEKKRSPSELTYEVLERSGYREFLENEGTEESFSRLENLNEFVNALKEYEETSQDPSLEEYLGNISLITSEEDSKELADYVILMTVHNAKGLEFKNVFMAGMEEGTFPHFLASDTKEGLEEERRLCYVAVTRAREKLDISLSRYTRKFGEVEARISSRFLEEIPRENLIGDFIESAYGVRRPDKSPQAKDAYPKAHKEESVSGKKGNQDFAVGKRVRHKVYGEGKIISMSGTGDNTKVEVRFGAHIEKKFLLAYTPLDIIS
ncbi:AAA family ATPase [Leptospira ognonensis]|uniref:DNA 3'-5' helicase n=1 Tax=Leptospira ognonensis TaxID=2484945 RepID=A0A4R9JYU5_9LEPT|nr:UvrD-helicase domain-containing protein [Leptospira ognonensis]TGL57385.1 AAA family ATPase [Leptospira ognonensis]